jgi:hypothetical protein
VGEGGRGERGDEGACAVAGAGSMYGRATLLLAACSWVACRCAATRMPVTSTVTQLSAVAVVIPHFFRWGTLRAPLFGGNGPVATALSGFAASVFIYNPAAQKTSTHPLPTHSSRGLHTPPRLSACRACEV